MMLQSRISPYLSTLALGRKFSSANFVERVCPCRQYTYTPRRLNTWKRYGGHFFVLGKLLIRVGQDRGIGTPGTEQLLVQLGYGYEHRAEFLIFYGNHFVK